MRQCAICGKGSVIRGKRKLLRGHYNPTTKSRRYPNLQYAKVDGSRALICVQCMRTRTKTRAPRVRATAPKTLATAHAS